MSEYKCQNGDDVRIGGVYNTSNEPYETIAVTRIDEANPFSCRFEGYHGDDGMKPDTITSELPRDADGYYIWDGGAQPVPDDWMIEYKIGIAKMPCPLPAEQLVWGAVDISEKITCFKVVSTGQEVEDQVYSTPGEKITLGDAEPKLDGYVVNIKGVDVDFYDIMVAYDIRCPATQHAIKKLLKAGNRGAKDILQDYREARGSIVRAEALARGE